MPFAPILETNHHRQTIIFRAPLLFDESAESFFWLFSNFLKAMSGKHPETIFTDQCDVMAKAIEIALPNSCHRLCIWHIYQNAAKHLSHVIGKIVIFSRTSRAVYLHKIMSMDRTEDEAIYL
jgi:zinc finger SWIM domain-containing protein 3